MVEETPQRRRGHAFFGLGKERYLNKGRVTMRGLNELGENSAMEFHFAEGITEPLARVASSNDLDQIVVFDSTADRAGSKIVKGSSPEGQAIRAAVTKAKGTPIGRVRNTYQVRLWITDGGSANESEDFTRPVP